MFQMNEVLKNSIAFDGNRICCVENEYEYREVLGLNRELPKYDMLGKCTYSLCEEWYHLSVITRRIVKTFYFNK